MTGQLADVVPGVAFGDLVHITEWVVGAAMLTTALGVLGVHLLGRRPIGVQVALVAGVTMVTALASVLAICWLMFDIVDRDVMLELVSIAVLAGLAVALVIGRSVTRASRRLLEGSRND